MVPNLIPTYPRVNEAAKDLMTAALGVGLLRLAGMKLEVGQLNIKTLAFGALTTAAGAALGREGIIRGLGPNISSLTERNQDPIALAILTVAAAATLAVTQYSRVGSYLPSFTQLDRNQALALGGSAIGSMVAMRYFGFADQAKVERKPSQREAELYDNKEGAIKDMDVAKMACLLGELDAQQVRLSSEQIRAFDARFDELSIEEDVSALRKLGEV